MDLSAEVAQLVDFVSESPLSTRDPSFNESDAAAPGADEIAAAFDGDDDVSLMITEIYGAAPDDKGAPRGVEEVKEAKDDEDDEDDDDDDEDEDEDETPLAPLVPRPPPVARPRGRAQRTVVVHNRAEAGMLKRAVEQASSATSDMTEEEQSAADYHRKRAQQVRAARLCGNLPRDDNITLHNELVNDEWLVARMPKHLQRHNHRRGQGHTHHQALRRGRVR